MAYEIDRVITDLVAEMLVERLIPIFPVASAGFLPLDTAR